MFLGFAASILLSNREGNSQATKDYSYKSSYSNYQFISPLLDCGEQNNSSNFYKYLKSDLKKLSEDLVERNEAQHISVYFRDLNNGPWVGINEAEKFSPASMMKVPLMIAYLKLAESDSELLNRSIKIDSVHNTLEPNLPEEKSLDLDGDYLTIELIEKMIIDSDNYAASVLLQNINDHDLDLVYLDLGFQPNEWKYGMKENYMTVREYSSFFRVLYNASYLNRDMSELALAILSQTNFHHGLKAGVGENVVVSHKYGERSILGSQQLHDCGIIYHRNNPYLLCLMTRGSNFDKMQNVIAEISELVYNTIDK